MPQPRSAAAKDKIKRAAGLLRAAARDLAAEADADVLGTFRVTDPEGAADVAAALSLALSQRGPLEVTVLVAPRPYPTTVPLNGAKENTA